MYVESSKLTPTPIHRPKWFARLGPREGLQENIASAYIFAKIAVFMGLLIL